MYKSGKAVHTTTINYFEIGRSAADWKWGCRYESDRQNCVGSIDLAGSYGSAVD